jgi:hypothetical protein
MPIMFNACAALEQGVSMEVEIGRVMYYYEHMDMAVLLLKDTLMAGDHIRIQGMMTDFVQPVAFMEIDHSRVLRAQPGDNVAIKVSRPVQKEDVVYRVISEVKAIQAQEDFEREPAMV